MPLSKPSDSPRHQAVFAPLQVGPLTLANRLMALPVYTGYAYPDGMVSPMLVKHYARLGQSGVSVVVAANAAVAADGIGSTYNLRADHDRFIPGLARLAAAIKAGGAIACLQLNHTGRYAKTTHPLMPSRLDSDNLAFNINALKDFMNFFPFDKRFGLTRYFLKLFNSWKQPMTGTEHQRIIQAFAHAARRAHQAGFDMIELHGANGYLLCQYLSPATNRHSDGGLKTLEQRAAIPTAIIRAVKMSLPEDVPVGYRLTLDEWVPGGIELPEALAWAQMLEIEGIAYLSATAGTYSAIFSGRRLKQMTRPAFLKDAVSRLSEKVAIATVISGRVTALPLADKLIRSGACTLIGLGRSLRADADWVKKARGENRRKIAVCNNCHDCLRRVILDQGFNCLQWPRMKREAVDLRHKMLSRSYNGLWIVADKEDVHYLQTALPELLPVRKHLPASHTVIVVDQGNAAPLSPAERDAFLDWGRRLLAHRGYAEDALRQVEWRITSTVENDLQTLIETHHYGFIVLCRRPQELWRQRLLYRNRGRASVFVGPGGRRRKILVPVDLSPGSALALKFIGRLYAAPSFTFQFIHVLDGPAAPVEKRWQELKTLAGLPPEAELTFTPATGPVADTLLIQVRKGGYGCIIMGKRGQSGIKRLLLGSVSARLLRGLTDQTLILID